MSLLYINIDDIFILVTVKTNLSITMAFQYSIRLCGAGGYGLIQAARILAEAAAIYDNKNAAESCSYGPEARGSSGSRRQLGTYGEVSRFEHLQPVRQADKGALLSK